ncbi:hypothetical protein ACIBIZ_49000 [Nonomuraea spiralis]|uniref:hypothetical protein n=1 Tax=Nonomuraea TaxID=83681 RepID=UPI00163C2E0D|nr:hypothetical protein [Nonomuraea sp. WAC 01424]
MVKWLVLLLACALTGCAGPVGTAGRTSSPAPPAASGPASTAPDGAGAAGAPDSAAEAPDSADGDRFSACADARCEVSLAAGDVLRFGRRYGISRFAVESVRGDKVTWEANFTSGGNMSTQGEQGGSSSCRFDGSRGCSGYIRGVTTLTLNDVILRFLSFDEGRAVVRVTPKR